MAVTSSAAQTVSDDILSTNDGILAISVMDMRGNILATKSKESFKEAFGVTREGDKYGGSLAVAALAVANEVKDVAGEPKALITIYKKCKMMLLPLPSYEILVGLVLQPSINAEDFIALLTRLKDWWQKPLSHRSKHWYLLEDKSQHVLSISSAPQVSI